MIETLHHRGPDQTGFAHYDQVVLGNSRLSIVDIDGGRQPIFNEDKTICVVYNGEIYNYPALRQEMEKKGHLFKTNTDTEILVHLYEEEGIGFVKRLNGMFTFALYDKGKKRLLLGRDRFGVKPLFYTNINGVLAFASEIKALKTLPYFDTTISPEGISTFLGLFYIPDPWTIYKSVLKLPPGHMLIAEGVAQKLYTYFDLDYTSKQKISRHEAEDEIARLLEQSVKRQLLADVPISVLLSGGLDSTSVLAASSKHLENLNAYTISFDESLYNEGQLAKKWADFYKSRHFQYLFTEEEFCDHLLSRQKHLDEPYGLWCNVATASLSKFIGKRGSKVVLSGDGGDELFMGYPTIHAAMISRYYRLLPNWFRKEILKPLSKKMPAGSGRLPIGFILKSFILADHPEFFRTFFGFKEVLHYDEWQDLLTPEVFNIIKNIDPYISFKQHFPKIESLSLQDAMAYLDFKVFLPGCSFTGHDNAYMSESVELRVPMMDNDLVDFACSLPTNLRYHPFQPKILLRQALKKHMTPPPSISRRDLYAKRGFEIPGTEWLRHGHRFNSLIKRILTAQRIKSTGVFQLESVNKILDDQLSGKRNNERKLQAIMSLVLFIDGSYSL